MELSTSTNIYFERDFEPFVSVRETITQCAGAGFRNLDFGFAELALVSEQFKGANWAEEIQTYKELAESLGMRFVQAHATIFDFCNLCRQGKDYDCREELFYRSLAGAQMLGVYWVTVHPSTFLVNGKIHPDTHLKNVEFFKQYAQIAQKLGIGLAVENMWGTVGKGEKPYCLEAAELLKLIEDVNCENVKVCWDVEHGSIERLDQREALHLLKSHVTTLHISDESGPDNIHILPYQGKADWKEILDTLAEIDYKGFFNLEIQHFLPKVPKELAPAAMKLARETGEWMVREIEERKKEWGYG